MDRESNANSEASVQGTVWQVDQKYKMHYTKCIINVWGCCGNFPPKIVSKFKESKLISILKNLQVENKSRSMRRTLHEPNLIIWFGACKNRRMNQLGSTDLYLGRPAVLFDCASRIVRQKFDFDLDVELLHVPNQMHTQSQSAPSARSIDLA